MYFFWLELTLSKRVFVILLNLHKDTFTVITRQAIHSKSSSLFWPGSPCVFTISSSFDSTNPYSSWFIGQYWRRPPSTAWFCSSIRHLLFWSYRQRLSKAKGSRFLTLLPTFSNIRRFPIIRTWVLRKNYLEILRFMWLHSDSSTRTEQFLIAGIRNGDEIGSKFITSFK